TDQLFHLMVGRDLMQRYGKRPQVVMTTPILEGIDARIEDGKIVGKKMSKSAENYIGLTESPLEIFRKCMQIDDSVIWRFFELLSSRTQPEIAALRGAGNPLEVKKSFAAEIVERYHGAEAAAQAAERFDAAYFSDRPPDDTPELRLMTEGTTLWLPKALSMAKLVPSTSEGRRLIAQGGVEVDGQRVSDVQHQLALEQRYLVRVGSKKRRYCYIHVSRH